MKTKLTKLEPYRVIAVIAWLGYLSAVVLIFLSALGGMSGINMDGITSIMAIPNYIVMGVCVVAGIIARFFRPSFANVPPIFSAGIILFYVALFILICNSPFLGHYKLKVKIIDEYGKPVAGVPIDSLTQKQLNFPSIFLPDNVKTTEITNEEGVAMISGNYFKRSSSYVNWKFSAAPEKLNGNFKNASFGLDECRKNKTKAQIGWTKKGNYVGYSTEPFDPALKPLTIILPLLNGSETFDYSTVQ